MYNLFLLSNLSVQIAHQVKMNGNNNLRQQREQNRQMDWWDMVTFVDRFRMERLGRAYAASPFDRYVNIYRRVWASYPMDVQNGIQPPPNNHNSGVWLQELWDEEDEEERERNVNRINVANNAPNNNNNIQPIQLMMVGVGGNRNNVPNNIRRQN